MVESLRRHLRDHKEAGQLSIFNPHPRSSKQYPPTMRSTNQGSRSPLIETVETKQAQALSGNRCNVLIALELATKAQTSAAKIGEAFPWMLGCATGPPARTTRFAVIQEVDTAPAKFGHNIWRSYVRVFEKVLIYTFPGVPNYRARHLKLMECDTPYSNPAHSYR